MLRVTILESPREGLSHEEILKHAFTILQPEYRTLESLREYASKKLRTEIGPGYSEEGIGDIQLEIYPPITRDQGRLYDMIYNNKDFPKRSLVRIASQFGIVAEELLPYDNVDNIDERFAEAYRIITGKPCSPDEVKGPPHFKGGVIIESLLSIL